MGTPPLQMNPPGLIRADRGRRAVEITESGVSGAQEPKTRLEDNPRLDVVDGEAFPLIKALMQPVEHDMVILACQ